MIEFFLSFLFPANKPSKSWCCYGWLIYCWFSSRFVPEESTPNEQTEMFMNESTSSDTTHLIDDLNPARIGDTSSTDLPNSPVTCVMELSALSDEQLLELTKVGSCYNTGLSSRCMWQIDYVKHISLWLQKLDTNYLRLNIHRVDGKKLHNLLMRVDADTARTIHPNTPRKTIRALEVRLLQIYIKQFLVVVDISQNYLRLYW